MGVYSMDLRQRVLARCDQGHGTKAVAELFGVAASWVRRLKQRRREDGSIAPRPSGGDRRSRLDQTASKRLAQRVKAQPDATLEQLREWCQVELKVSCSIMAVSRTLKKLGFSFKKRRSGRPSRIGPMSCGNARIGRPAPRASILSVSSSSMNQAPKRT